jgi:hypothetical protein
MGCWKSIVQALGRAAEVEIETRCKLHVSHLPPSCLMDVNYVVSEHFHVGHSLLTSTASSKISTTARSGRTLQRQAVSLEWIQLIKVSLLQILIHVSHGVMSHAKSSKGFTLLRVIRKFNELNSFLSLQTQTEKTMTAFEATLSMFSDCLKVRSNIYVGVGAGMPILYCCRYSNISADTTQILLIETV